VFLSIPDSFSKLYNSAVVVCPLCNQRSARRFCPALGHQICAACCGTKRLVEIQCPADCPYLARSREHPPAAKVRQQQREIALLVRAVRDLSDRQSRLLFLVLAFVARYEAPEFQALVDEDVVEAMTALSATFETAVRGVIYEQRPTSLPAERLANGLRTVLAKAGDTGGTAFQRDAAVVLRRIEAASREASDRGNRRAFIEVATRITRSDRHAGEAKEEESPQIIIP